jgi:transposase
VHRPPFESREVLRLLRHRHKLVQIRTRAKNGLQALPFSAGSSGRSRLLSREGREQFLQLPMSEAIGRQREEWLSLVDDLNKRIKSLDAWLDERAKCDERVLRLQTHPGIGLLTSLALVHALEPVSRFAGGRKVAARTERLERPRCDSPSTPTCARRSALSAYPTTRRSTALCGASPTRRSTKCSSPLSQGRAWTEG